MPSVRKTIVTEPRPIAVLCADIHLSLTAPVSRADKDWMETQASYLKQLRDIANGCPVLCAGDIFDRWNTPAELISFAFEHLPDKMVCIPGQHDLPEHRIDQMHRSGYGVLKQAHKITDLSGGAFWSTPDLMVHGFGWGESILPYPWWTSGEYGKIIRVVLVHRYCWIPSSNPVPDAPIENRADRLYSEVKSYQVAVFGDNHQGFLRPDPVCTVINCGTLLRRKRDEISYQPSVGILYDNGKVKRMRLDTSVDAFHEGVSEKEEVPFNMREFVKRLEGLGEHGLDFRETVERYLENEDVSEEVKRIVLQALES